MSQDKDRVAFTMEEVAHFSVPTTYTHCFRSLFFCREKEKEEEEEKRKATLSKPDGKRWRRLDTRKKKYLPVCYADKKENYYSNFVVYTLGMPRFSFSPKFFSSPTLSSNCRYRQMALLAKCSALNYYDNNICNHLLIPWEIELNSSVYRIIPQVFLHKERFLAVFHSVRFVRYFEK